MPALKLLDKKSMSIAVKNEILTIRRWNGTSQVFLLFNFTDEIISTDIPISGKWLRKIDSTEKCWLGNGTVSPEIFENEITINPLNFILYQPEGL